MSEHKNNNNKLDFCTLLCFFRKLRKGRGFQILANLAFALLSANLIILFGLEATDNHIVCICVAASIHFFILAAFGWMSVQVKSSRFVYPRKLCKRYSQFYGQARSQPSLRGGQQSCEGP